MIGKEWRRVVRWVAAVGGLAVLSGCGLDYRAGERLAGQECYAPEDCAEGLICVERRCRPELGSGVILEEEESGGEESEGDSQGVGGETGGGNESGDGEAGGGEQGGSEDGGSGDGVEKGEGGGGEGADCCAGGCAPGEICSGCICEAYDRSVCEFQDQPCAFDGQISNGYICSRWGDDLDLRCYGICNPEAQEPNETCPGSTEAICVADDAGPNGFCISSCQVNQPCADDGLRGVYSDVGSGDGVCFPTSGSGEPGDSCDESDFFSCGGQSICVAGSCAQSCRPFKEGETDCESGSFCLAFDGNFGVCAPNTQTSMVTCSEIFTTCNGDATGCFPAPNSTELICYEFCRLERGNQDCGPGRQCFQHDAQNDQLGICF